MSTPVTRYGTMITALDATPRVLQKPVDLGGSLKFQYDTYTFITDGTEDIGSTYTLGRVPIGARVIGFLSYLRTDGAIDTGGTLSVGDAGAAARYLVATAADGGAIDARLVAAAGADYEVVAGNEDIKVTLAGGDNNNAVKMELFLVYIELNK